MYSNYCKTRNKVQRDIKKAKSSYFRDKISENKSNPKKLWQHLKSLGYSSKSKDQSQVVINIDGDLCFDTTKVANYINRFYTSVASKLVQCLAPSSGRFDTDSDNFHDYYNQMGVSENDFHLSAVSADFVHKELDRLNPSKSTGLDEIPARFLKDGAASLKDHLTHIINLSISSNTVPNEFKLARVRPLFKKNSRSEAGNYRPISILCVASKLLERAVYTQIENYLRDNDILYSFQSGFRGTYSTDTCLIHLTDHIRSEMSKGNYTGMVLLDLQKAFDTVDHVILCNKLRAMGFSSVDWIRSYLSDRKQIVNVNKVDSDPRNITCGVPQGSLLGPLLFLCYVNDMPVSVKCKLILYADDSALLISHKNPQYIADMLSRELDSCREWLIDNKLSLHLGKTESILFCSKYRIRKSGAFLVTCNGEKIAPTTSAKYLGVTLDQNLSGDSVANDVIKKAAARLKFLYRQAKSLNESSRKILCSALIQCYFDFACSSWYSPLSQQYKKKLQIMQNKIVRFILDLGPRSHIGQDELDRVGFLSVKDRVQQLKLNMVFKIFHGTSPDYLKSNFTRLSTLHTYSTRGSPYNFHVPKTQGQACSTFFFTAIGHWNNLPSNIKEINNISRFKKAVKKHLSDQARLLEQY